MFYYLQFGFNRLRSIRGVGRSKCCATTDRQVCGCGSRSVDGGVKRVFEYWLFRIFPMKMMHVFLRYVVNIISKESKEWRKHGGYF